MDFVGLTTLLTDVGLPVLISAFLAIIVWKQNETIKGFSSSVQVVSETMKDISRTMDDISRRLDKLEDKVDNIK